MPSPFPINRQLFNCTSVAFFKRGNQTKGTANSHPSSKITVILSSVKNNYGIPPSKSIPACIILIDKENAQSRKGVFIIDAGKGFIKDGNKNRLHEQDIHKIADVFNKQEQIPGFQQNGFFNGY